MRDSDNKLPNPDSAWIEERKIRNYLLDLDHPQGSSKAKFFIARGFTIEDWNVFEIALIEQGTRNHVVRTVDHQYGKRYTVECICQTPDKLNPCVRSVWEVKFETDAPRLITAHPHQDK